jgi:hypothetical protein
MKELSCTSVGRAGEFFASTVLEAHGIYTVHVQIPDDDLWCRTPSGNIFRVQVKASNGPTVDRIGARSQLPIYRFRTGRRKQSYNGIYIFVALDVRLCTAMSWSADGQRPPMSIRVPASKFTSADEIESIEREFFL